MHYPLLTSGTYCFFYTWMFTGPFEVAQIKQLQFWLSCIFSCNLISESNCAKKQKTHQCAGLLCWFIFTLKYQTWNWNRSIRSLSVNIAHGCLISPFKHKTYNCISYFALPVYRLVIPPPPNSFIITQHAFCWVNSAPAGQRKIDLFVYRREGVCRRKHE